jgi:hypothetical protein
LTKKAGVESTLRVLGRIVLVGGGWRFVDSPSMKGHAGARKKYCEVN